MLTHNKLQTLMKGFGSIGIFDVLVEAAFRHLSQTLKLFIVLLYV